MKIIKTIIITVSIFICIKSFAQDEKHSQCNREKEIHHIENRQDSTKWDLTLLNRDIDNKKSRENVLPINFGAWPTPRYSLLGNGTFKGVGNGGNFEGIDLNGKKLLYAYLLVNKNKVTSKYIGDMPNEIFFTIVVLTDFIDTTNYSNAGLYISSRNNPDYIGEGFFKTKNNKIDYLAFLTADRNEYAIINMRLFNLKLGRTILVAPQKNGSLRSMQIKGEIHSDKEIENYIKSLLLRKDIKAFFSKPGNI